VSDDATAPHTASATIAGITITGRPTRRAGAASVAHPVRHFAAAAPIEVSVVMPCLNEVDSVGICVGKARAGLARAGLGGEVVVADNGSTDGSIDVAAAAGARIVHQPRRGYGAAYLAGFAAARGRYIVMGDSDDSYDFSELGALVGPLAAGEADYVLGSRFSGEILPGAMPWSHRYIGNPILTGMLNLMFGVRSSDAHSGMRAFTRDAYVRMNPRCEGMELASELVINAAQAGLRVREVPITYHPRAGASKLRGLRDAWRHVRFMLMLAPRFLFVLPGLALLVVGIVGQLALLPAGVDAALHRAGVHVSVLFTLIAILGYQLTCFGVFADAMNAARGRGGRRGRTRLADLLGLERALACGAALFAAGLTIESACLAGWLSGDIGPLDAFRVALLAMTAMAIGVQTAFGGFVLRLAVSHGDLAADRGAAAVTETVAEPA
jgi:Glycosyl transferase family 2